MIEGVAGMWKIALYKKTLSQWKINKFTEEILSYIKTYYIA